MEQSLPDLPAKLTTDSPEYLAVLGGLLCVACLSVLIVVGQDKQTELVAFIFLTLVTPLTVGLLIVYGRLGPIPLTTLEAILATSLLVGTALIYAKEYHWFSVDRELSAVLPGLLGLAIGGPLCFFRTSWLAASVEAWLIGAFALIVILLSPFEASQPIGSSLIGYASHIASPPLWIAAAAAFFILAAFVNRWENHQSSRATARFAALVALVLVLLFICSLYDDGHYFDLMHYMPYIGPALHRRAGGTPMVDVYCQYGLLPWVIVDAVFSFLPAKFGTMAVLVRIVNIIYWSIIALILFSVARRRVTALFLFLPVLVTGITFHANMLDLNSLPSAQGMRYLPPALMALTLCIRRQGIRTRWAALVILIISAFWSLETFMFTSLVWGGNLVLETVRRRDWRAGAIESAIGVAAILLAHALFALAIFVTSEHWVNYYPYFDLFMQFRLGTELDWALPVSDSYSWWIPVWLAIFLTLSQAGIAALRGQERGMSNRLAPIALLGVGLTSYFVGRSTETTLGLGLFPFAILLICGLQAQLDSPPPTTPFKRYAIALSAMSLALIFIFGLERFSRPVSPVLGNSTILRHCFSIYGCTPSAVARRIEASLNASPLSLDLSDLRNWQIAGAKVVKNIRDLIDMIRAQGYVGRHVSVLPDIKSAPYIGMLALTETGSWYRWPLSSPLNDGLSSVLTNRIVQAVRPQSGETVIVARQEDKLISVELDILAKIKSHCQIRQISQTDDYSLYRLGECRRDRSP